MQINCKINIKVIIFIYISSLVINYRIVLLEGPSFDVFFGIIVSVFTYNILAVDVLYNESFIEFFSQF